MRIKICGITNLEDANNAISLGANAIGFIFQRDSGRYIPVEKAEEIALFLPPFISTVGVFVDSPIEEIEEISERCRLNLLQLHGNESPEFCLKMKQRVIKAFRVAELEDIEKIAKYQGMISAALVDTKVKDLMGGTGQTFDWGIALKAKEFSVPLILAGGINASNIKKAIQLVNPYAIDLCTSVESEIGKKDYNKMKEVISLAQSF